MCGIKVSPPIKRRPASCARRVRSWNTPQASISKRSRITARIQGCRPCVRWGCSNQSRIRRAGSSHLSALPSSPTPRKSGCGTTCNSRRSRMRRMTSTHACTPQYRRARLRSWRKPMPSVFRGMAVMLTPVEYAKTRGPPNASSSMGAGRMGSPGAKEIRPPLAPGRLAMRPPASGGLMANLPGAKGGLISFAPGDPIRPAPMLDDAFGGPRVFAYSTGVNITAIPRNTEGIGFLQLRNLARLYWGVQACVEVILRILDRLELQVVPHPDFLGVGDDGNADKWLEPARRIRDWFEQPHRTQGLHPWMRAVMRDLLEIDACGVFHERTRRGQLAGLRLIAGDTLIRYIDTVGTVPVRPYPAYRQAVHGAIGWEGTADDLDYLRVEERTDSLYCLPPTEQIIVILNTALRAQSFDLTQYTRVSTPDGWVETDNPALLNVSADQIKTFEDLLNATLAGNDALRVGLKAMIPGWHYKQTKANQAPLPLHEFLLAATVSMYGLSKEELSFTDTSNRSTGAKQEDVVYRNAVRPRTDFIARYFNGIIRRYDGLAIADRNAMLSLPGRATKPAKGMWDSRFRVRWGGIEEPEDWNQRAFALNALSKSGIIGPTQVKHMLKIPVMPGEQHVPPWTLAPAGPNSIVFLDDLLAQRDQINAAHGAQLDAQTQQAQQQTAIGSEQQQQATLDTQAKKHQLTMAQLQIEATKEHNKQAKEQTTQMGQQTQAQAQQLANPQQGPQSPKSGGPPRPPTGGGQPNGPRPAAPSGAAPAASRPALANRGGPTVSGGRKSGCRGADDAVGSAVATTGNEYDADFAGARADASEPADGTDTTSPVGGADNPSGRGAGLHDAARVPADDRDAAGPGQGGPGDAAYRPRAEPDEWRAWRQKALKAAKEGRRQPAWDRTGTALPEDAHQHVSTQLAGIKTPDEERAIFEAARQRRPPHPPPPPETLTPA